jgi:hypothetical protein
MDDLDNLALLKKELLKEIKTVTEKAAKFKNKRETAKQQSRSMGLGDLADPTMMFVRKFRWTLKSTVLQEHFVKKVDFDFTKQVLRIQVYEVVNTAEDDINVQKWLESDMSKDILVFTTYDGCGTPMYQYELTGLMLLEDKANFDYSDSDVSTRHIGIAFEEMKRTYFGKEQNKISVPKKGFKWKIRVQGSQDSYDVKVKARPTVDIQETEINFLNAKTWIPGKATWQDLHMEMERQHDMKPVTLLTQGSQPNLELELYDMTGKEHFETWLLKGCQLVSMYVANTENEKERDKFSFKIKYPSVEYKPVKQGECNTVIK